MFQHPNSTAYHHEQRPTTTTTTQPIVESDEILLEFQSANDRLQQKRRADCPTEGLSDHLMLQGNLGIYVEREGIDATCGGRQEQLVSYNENLFSDYAGSHEMAGLDYAQYYRMNSVNYSSNDSVVSDTQCAGRMDYGMVEPNAMYVNQS